MSAFSARNFVKADSHYVHPELGECRQEANETVWTAAFKGFAKCLNVGLDCSCGVRRE